MSITLGLHRSAAQWPDKLALVEEGYQLTFAQLRDQVASCAGVYRQMGLEEGDRIGILSLNSVDAIVAFYGALWAGLIPNYLNNRWSEYELSASIDDCGASILLIDENFKGMGEALLAQSQSLQCLRELVALRGVIDATAPIDDVKSEPSSVAFLNYTGGTTGKGKGVAHSHAGHDAAMNIALAEQFFVRGTTCLAVPLFHIGGISVVSASIKVGNTLHMVKAFEPLTMLKFIQSQKIVQGFLVPTMLTMMVNHPEFSNHDISCFRHVRYGASPIDEAQLLALKEALPAASFMQIYGQTECVPATLLHDIDHRDRAVELGRIRSAGCAVSGVDIEIRDENSRVLNLGEIGEIALRGPHVMLRYWNNESQTAEVLNNGWLSTGDAGYLDDDGYLYVVDRIKDMIVTGGENVYSLEVESAICEHPDVLQCAVVGLADEKWVERVHAEIVLRPDICLTQKEVTTYCRDFLAGYKTPRSMSFVKALPLTAVGKVDKVAIRKAYQAG